MSVNRFALAASFALLALPIRNAPAQIDHNHQDAVAAPANIGRVAFPSSCSAKAQVDLEKGVALLHSFWYEEAAKEFEATAGADPSCAIAYWGEAMSTFHQLWENPDTAARHKATIALNSARNASEASARERAYINALAQYYEAKSKTATDTATPEDRLRAYTDAMAELSRAYPTDDEAKIFYGLSIIAAAPGGDTTFTALKRADSVLLPLVAKYPTHPGLFHYIIHANDEPELAPLALDAARRYAQLAPAIPHAQHMPSHIFIRLGLWDDVITSNVLATWTGTTYAHAEHMNGEWPHNLHTMDFLQYAYLQEGRDREAQQIVDKVLRTERVVGAPSSLRFYQAYLAARQLIETGQWREAARLHLSTPADSNSAYSEIILAFTRAVGSGRSGDATTARVEVGRLDSLSNYFAQRKDTATARYLKNVATTASAWVQLSLGNRDEAVRLAREGATGENDASETSLVPATELAGDLLLAVGQPAEARKEYELALRRNPNRARSLYGAASAAAKSGDSAGAQRMYAQYIALMTHSDGTRPELITAKQFVASR